MRGIVGYFKKSTTGISNLKLIQAECENPVTKPIQDVTTRWRSAYDMANWFRIQRESVILFDINHFREANDVYKENRLELLDWDIIAQSVAVLSGLADANQVRSRFTLQTTARGEYTHNLITLSHPQSHTARFSRAPTM